MTTKTNKYKVPFLMMVVLFFLFGFLTVLNGQLQSPIKVVFNLSNFQTSLLTFSFFSAFVLTGPLASKLIDKKGNKTTLVLALVVLAVALSIFLGAANINSFEVFVGGSFILGAGITMLQVVANPYLAALGSPETAGTRINLAGAFNSLAGTIAPIFAANVIFGGAKPSVEDVKMPYIGLTIFAVVLAVVFYLLKLPEIKAAGDETKEGEQTKKLDGNAWQFSHLTLGVIAIFAYVGAEVAIGNNIKTYLDSFIGSDASDESRKILTGASALIATFYWGSIMIGRFVGSFGFKNADPRKALILVSAGSMIFTAIGAFYPGEIVLTEINLFGLTKFNIIGNVGVYALVIVGLAHSVMWGYIFGLAINKLGPYTNQGSGYLLMGVFGGAVIPTVQSLMADGTNNWQITFIIVAVCQAYLLYYALIGSKVKKSAV
jgi:FHS family L-fucose permease-like MFS transporter